MTDALVLHGMLAGGVLSILMVFGMGVRHGLDPDHLSAINAILRFQSAKRHRPVRWAGLYFSLGHGIVVMITGVVVTLMAVQRRVPSSIETAGGLFSGLFLLGMAGINGFYLDRSTPTSPFSPIGPKTRWLFRGVPLNRPSIIVLGMLFAISFDTLSQTIVFSLAGASWGGMAGCLVVGAAFISGMSLSDGANGLWIARLIEKADLGGIRLSRVMGWAVVALSVLIGTSILTTTLRNDAPVISPLTETLAGIGVILLVSCSYLFAACFFRGKNA